MPSKDTARRSTSAAATLGPVLRRQVADLRARENDVRERRPDAVHDFRVACRRLRATLAGLEPLLDAPTCRRLADDLRRTARAVAPARDAQAVRSQVDAMSSSGGDAVARLRSRLLLLLDEDETTGWQHALTHLDHAAYDDLTRRLERFADLPPWQPDAHLPADDVLLPLLHDEWSRFRRRARTVVDARDSPTADERLHAVRKASKRARYLAEATTEVFGRRAKRLAKAAEAVQETLGEHQDRVLIRMFLTDAQAQLTLDDEERRAIVVIHDAGVTAADTDWKAVRGALKDVDRKSLRAWMR